MELTIKGTSLRRYTSSWQTDCAAQGAYYSTNSGRSQRGRATFSGLSTFDTSAHTITGVKLQMKFDSSGAAKKKKIQCYFNSTNNNTYKVSAQTTNAIAYNKTTYIQWTSASDIAIIVSAIEAGTNYITFYNGETASSSYSSNYCKITAATLYIYYDEGGISKVVKYTDGVDWVDCNVFYCDGEKWIECAPMYCDGNNWIECG